MTQTTETARLDRVSRAVVLLATAEREYRDAMRAAIEGGSSGAAVARAAGISRQAVNRYVRPEVAR